MGVLLSDLFRQQAVHDEDQRSLQAVEDSEDVCKRCGPLLKQEGPEHPHQTQYAHLGNSCHCESFDFIQFGEVWVEAGELLGELPDGDDEKEDVEDDDDAHGAKETPDEAVFQGQPAVIIGAITAGSNDGRYNDDNKGYPVTGDQQIEGPHVGVEDQDHHAVQLHPF